MMTAHAAQRLGFAVHIYTPRADDVALRVTNLATIAPYEDEERLHRFTEACDVVTLEFENIPSKSLEIVEQAGKLRPASHAVYISQNRKREKDFCAKLGLRTTPYAEVRRPEDITGAYRTLGTQKAVLKTAELGYDGKGQYVISGARQIPEAALWHEEAGNPACIMEAFVPFERELSIITVRGADGRQIYYPLAQNVHEGGILRSSVAPAIVSDDMQQEAREIARTVASELGYIGVLAIEMFEAGGELYINEFAPRPHNSGHWTMDGACCSQFEQLVRAALDLPLGGTDALYETRMENILGREAEDAYKLLMDERAHLHLYGKEIRDGRKMGHVNIWKKRL